MMKFFKVTSALLILAICGCKEKVDTSVEGTNKWVYETMKREYLWSASIPDFVSTNLSVSPVSYFNNYVRHRENSSVPYSEDRYGDRFSSVSQKNGSSSESLKLSNDTEHNFGLLFRSFVYGNDINVAQIINVVPGSPAAVAGLERNMFVTKVNNLSLPVSTTVFYNEINVSPQIVLTIAGRSGTVSISKRDYLNTPIIFSSVIESTPRCGYLVYSHFSRGDKDRFNKELDAVFASFKAAGVRDLILDLRFNGGGELYTARYIASLIGRSDMLGDVLMYEESNKNFGVNANFEPIYLLSRSEMENKCLGTDRICVLTSKNSASASELIIHCLKPYYTGKLFVIGEKTYGKNLGGHEISSSKYLWKINPITLRVNDKNRVSGYEQGIPPDVACDEFLNGGHIGQYGDPANERLLATALNKLYGWPTPPSTTRSGGESPTPSLEGLTPVTPFDDRGLIDEKIFVD